MNIKFEKSIKIGTAIGLTISIFVVISTLVMASYSLLFMNKMFTYIIPNGQLYNQLIIFKDNIQQIILSFLILGLIFSYFITKMIVNPIEKLIKGTKELAKGHLSHRINLSKYYEVNELINTYNKMAENLETLYKNLDSKVKERTKELETANNELKSTQAMVVHSEKMGSLGQLVAGITHEINNPVNFIHGNLVHLKKYSKDLLEIINCYVQFEGEFSQEHRAEIDNLKKKIELDFIIEDLPQLIQSCQEGSTRTKNIILDLKNFSRLDELVINSIHLEKEIETTLNILQNKIKNRIEVIKEYDSNLSMIECYGGQLNQVFMNILDNACYSIKEKGKIFIRLKNLGNDVLIEFEDTGCGMKKEQLEKIFEPFYTTKPVGEGTGLGMSISYKVIQEHNGKLNVESTEGNGTKFIIHLPIKIQKAGVKNG